MRAALEPSAAAAADGSAPEALPESGMALTATELNRATLARQLLLRREPLDAVEGVRRVVALQAQEPASPYLALWNRLADFDPRQLDAAFADGTIVKASLFRITLHAVLATEYPAFHDAMRSSLRASRLGDRRYTGSGLTVADADALIEPLLDALQRPHTKDEIEALLEAHHGVAGAVGVVGAAHLRAGLPRPDRWPVVVRTTAGVHRRRGGSRDAGRPGRRHRIVAAALSRGVRPGLRGGLRPVHAAQATGDPPGGVRPWRRAGAGGRTRGDDAVRRPGRATPGPADRRSPRLLPMWDSMLLAYADRSRVIPPEHRRLVIRTNGDVLPTLLVDGHVAGVWRPADGGIEATAFQPLSDEAWAGLAAEATALTAFLADRDPTVYRRYDRWWATMPAGGRAAVTRRRPFVVTEPGLASPRST